MAFPIGFDNDCYLREQTAAILERVHQFNDKLYLEFGGKLLFDFHASRVLPGFDPNVKMRLLQQLRDQADIILAIYAGDIEKRKMRADFGITYDADAMKLIDELADWGIPVTAVVITRYADQPAARIFKNKLERRGVRVYTHRAIPGYPGDIDLVVSDEGYGSNPYVETTKPLVVVTGPGPNSGKLATCLSQLYHDYKQGRASGYAKFETFPIWNLPLKHMVNVAYEAATAELRDVNVIDPHHLEAHGTTTINYNRDVEAFPVLRMILEKITGKESPYQSPTDMGVNRAGFGIVDDEACQYASRQEIIRRHFRYAGEYMMGLVDAETTQRSEFLMRKNNLKDTDRPVVTPARKAAQEAEQQVLGHDDIYCGAALELPDGTIVTGKSSALMHAPSSLILNAVKQLAGIPDGIHLLAPTVIEAIATMKREVFGKDVSLDLEWTLAALAISAATNPMAQVAVEKLRELRGCEAHTTHLPSPGDEAGLRDLGINLTSDPEFSTNRLFVR